MALGDSYCTSAQLKTYMGATGSADDDAVTDAITAASRWIDHYTRRQFNKASVATAREFFPANGFAARVDDFHTTADLVIKTDESDDGTFENTWASTDYRLEPLNGIVDGESGWPYNRILVRAAGSYRFPGAYDAPSIQVTAQWGWNAVPALVKQACLITATEAFRMKDTTAGVGGNAEFGEFVIRRAPQALDYLKPYRLNPVLVA